MTIRIENIGKIQNAKLDLHGITVIVGDNNTGKSTIGKCLYSFFNALHGIDDEVGRQRRRQIYREIRGLSDSYAVHGMVTRALDRLIDGVLKSGNVDAIKSWISRNISQRIDETVIDKIAYNINSICNLPESHIKNQIIYNYFDSLFAGQFLTVKSGIKQGQVTGIIKGNQIQLNLYAQDLLVRIFVSVYSKKEIRLSVSIIYTQVK